jgi:hypothetical protein
MRPILKSLFGRALLFCALVSSLNLVAQPVWQKGPPPLTALSFGNATFVAGSSDGTLLSSTDTLSWTSHSFTNFSVGGIAFGKNLFVAVGDAGQILTSSNGNDWAPQSSGTSSNLSAVAFGNNQFIAVGKGGELIRSIDGVTWTKPSVLLFFPFDFRSITYAKGLFVAGGTRGVIYTSPDGLDWTYQSTGISNIIMGIASDGNQFVAVLDSSASPQNILTSPDGIDWTRRNSGIQEGMYGIAASSSTFVIVGFGGKLATSSDGISWTTHPSDTTQLLRGVSFLNDGLFAFGDNGTITVSGSGINWSQTVGSGADSFNDVIYADGEFVAVGQAALAGASAAVQTSAQGSLWRQWNSGITGPLTSIAFGAGKFVATGPGIFTSTDARTWTAATTPADADWTKVVYGNGLFVAVGNGSDFPPSVIITSPDGITWTQRDFDSFSQLEGVFFGNGQFVLTGSGFIATSSDGITWTERFNDNQYVFNNGAFGNGHFVVLGENFFANHRGVVVTSQDGIKWTEGPTETYDSLKDVTFAGNSFYIVGAYSGTFGSSVFTSSDGASLTPVTVPFGAGPLSAIAVGTDRIVAVGQYGLILSSDFSGAPKLSSFTSFTFSSQTPYQSGRPWNFYATNSSDAPGLFIRVQATTTPTVESSWTDLPGGGLMTGSGPAWTLSTSDVPAGTIYFRAIAAAPGYVDKISDVQGPVEIGVGIAPITDFKYFTTSPARSNNSWQFTAQEPSLFSDQRLRVQTSITPADEGSWTDLPGGGIMGHLDSAYSFSTQDIPTGKRFFRVIASAPGFSDRISTILGPVDVGDPLQKVADPISTTTQIDVSTLPSVSQPVEVDVNAIGDSVITLLLDPNLTSEKIQAALKMTGDPGSLVKLIVEKGKSLVTPELIAAVNSSIELKGTLDGNINLIGKELKTVLQKDPALAGEVASALMAHGDLQLAINLSQGNLHLSDLLTLGADGEGVLGAQELPPLPPGFAPAASPMASEHSFARVFAASASSDLTGEMTVTGDYSQSLDSGLAILIGGTNANANGSLEYDRLMVGGTARLSGVIGFGFVNLATGTNDQGSFQPPAGSVFDVVIASNIITTNLIVRGPVWADGRHFQWQVVNLDDGNQALRLTAVNVPPSVAIETGTTPQIVFPKNYSGYSLQARDSLTTGTWTTIATGTNRVNIDLTAPARFFRLIKP